VPGRVQGQSVRAVFGGEVDHLDDPAGVGVDGGQLGAPAAVGVVVAGAVGGGAPEQALGRVEAQLVGLGRDVERAEETVGGGVASAMLLARDSDLVTLAPAGWLPETVAALGLRTFPIPLDLDPLDLGMAWHPRNSADPAHRWFRDHLATAVRQAEEDV
jgi:DNA-binding transcriptional LysR family regulator